MSKSTPRLGKGLSAIIGHRPASPTDDPRPQGDPAPIGTASPFRRTPTDGPLREIPIGRIIANARQPRTHFDDQAIAALADSIRQRGILQPILVRTSGDQFELVAGERRWRAAKQAGVDRIPAIVREMNDAEALECALIENLQREDLGPLERASAYQSYLDEFKSGIDRLAERLGESRASISNYLRFLRLPDEIKEMIRSGQLGMGQARAIAGIADAQQQLALARLASRRNLAVRQVEALAREDKPVADAAAPAPSGRDRHMRDVETQLAKSLGVGVRLLPGRKKNSGKIVIRYNSLDEFDRIAERLGGRSALE